MSPRGAVFGWVNNLKKKEDDFTDSVLSNANWLQNVGVRTTVPSSLGSGPRGG